MRARLGLVDAGVDFEIREIQLKNKHKEFLKVSKDATVPVLELEDQVIQESLDIMSWAYLTYSSSKLQYFDESRIQSFDRDFKPLLDQYKYNQDSEVAKTAQKEASEFLKQLEAVLSPFLYNDYFTPTDYAILPFVRQFAHVDQEWFYAQDWQKVIFWLDCFKASPIFNEIMYKLSPWQVNDPPIIWSEI